MPHRVSSGGDPYVGRVLDQHFRVDAAIGSGAMARVYRAHQLGVGRDVALKILRSELL
jgi:serine/threonine protein kinase